MSFLGGEEQNTRDLEKGEVREEEKLGGRCVLKCLPKKKARGVYRPRLESNGASPPVQCSVGLKLGIFVSNPIEPQLSVGARVRTLEFKQASCSLTRLAIGTSGKIALVQQHASEIQICLSRA